MRDRIRIVIHIIAYLLANVIILYAGVRYIAENQEQTLRIFASFALAAVFLTVGTDLLFGE